MREQKKLRRNRTYRVFHPPHSLIIRSVLPNHPNPYIKRRRLCKIIKINFLIIKQKNNFCLNSPKSNTGKSNWAPILQHIYMFCNKKKCKATLFRSAVFKKTAAFSHTTKKLPLGSSCFKKNYS